MSLAALDPENRGKFAHSPADNLESLLQTAFAIVCFTTGPCGQFRSASDQVPMAQWLNETHREQLFKDKYVDLLHYEIEIERHITVYWRPFIPYLCRLVSHTWGVSVGLTLATHENYKAVLREALKYFKTFQETPMSYAISTPVPQKQKQQKHARPSTKTDNSGGDGGSDGGGDAASMDGRYPYPLKYTPGNDPSKWIPRFIDIKHLSAWKDSINA
jgi:hypothetical protein